MTGIDFSKVDRSIKSKVVLFGGVHNLSSALDHGVCPYCGDHIEWIYNPDADGSSYTGECYCEESKKIYWNAQVCSVNIEVLEKEF